jgi:two-component system nitrogen regulation sensor histidine kinase NtrY
MLSLDSRSIVGKRPLDLIGGEYAVLLGDVFEQIKNNPAIQWQRQLDLTLGSKELKLLVNVVALNTSEGEDAGLVAVFEDVTELEKMQRLAAWREVARRIAHEIKNPLTPIKLSAQRIDRKFADQVEDPVFGECTNLIIRQVEHLQQMVKEFSSFAKLPEVVLKSDYPAPLIQEIVADFKNSHHDIEWNLNFDGAVPSIKMDRDGIRRVMVNILTNAAEALRGMENGKIEIEVSHDRMLGWVRIEVRDNGPGLSDEERSRLFEPYFSRKKGGTGLGLTIVRSIISDHRGYVRAKPNQPTGTTLVVELPA